MSFQVSHCSAQSTSSKNDKCAPNLGRHWCLKDVSVDMDSKTGLKGIFSRKEAWLSYVSISLCVCPSLHVKLRFFLLTAKTLEILQVLTTLKSMGGEVAGSLQSIKIHRLVSFS